MSVVAMPQREVTSDPETSGSSDHPRRGFLSIRTDPFRVLVASQVAPLRGREVTVERGHFAPETETEGRSTADGGRAPTNSEPQEALSSEAALTCTTDCRTAPTASELHEPPARPKRL